jgi:ribosomal 50S subunit-recycling heat shock protein
MRVDLYLSEVCLVKTRTIAKKACDQDLVSINGKTAKAHAVVHPEDVVEYRLYNQRTRVRVVSIPVGNVSKKTAGQYYELLEQERLAATE